MQSEVMDFSRYRGTNPGSTPQRPLRTALVRLALLASGWLGVALPARADNPGYDRPGYGFTPVVLGAGEVTLEQGLADWSHDRQGGISSSLYSADSLLRLGLGGPLELQLGGLLYNYLHQTGAGLDYRSHGRGDTHLALKLALPSSHAAFSWGLLGSVEFTDGAPDFRNNRRQYLLGAQFNLQAGRRHSLGVYLEDVRSGGRDSRTLALSDSYSCSKSLMVYAETVLLQLPGRGHGSLAGAGLAWLVTPRWQFDLGFDRRLSGSASPWQANLGVSVYFGH